MQSNGNRSASPANQHNQEKYENDVGLNMKTACTALVCGVTIAATLAFSMPADSATESGKATYDTSCIHCHGKDGEGNTSQDKFWRMKIPRLNTAYIQQKSDAELTSVILNGKRKMPPAMVGLPETQHRSKIMGEQVPELITYIRSLKKK